jgi:hypothetical protein
MKGVVRMRSEKRHGGVTDMEEDDSKAAEIK